MDGVGQHGDDASGEHPGRTVWEDRWYAVPARWRELVTDALAVLLWGGATLIGESGTALWWCVAAALLLVLRRPAPALALVGTIAIHAFAGPNVFPALGCAAYTVGVRSRWGSGVAASGAAVLAFALAPWPDASPMDRLLELAFQVVLPLLVGLHLRRTRQLLAAYRDRAEALSCQERIATERAILRERHRIAQEMHDSLGHKLSLIVLHAGALELGGRQGAQAELLRRTGQEAMRELRKVIGVLRDGDGDDQPLDHADHRALAELVDSSRRAGVPVDESVDDAVWRLDPVLRRTAHRVVREALTNVHKHAGAVPTRLSLRVVGDELRIEVRNAAPDTPPSSTAAGARTGLAALTRRVALLGGSLEHGRQAGGDYLVLVRVPVGEVPARR
ncbi:Signal transduction histidine kinase [Streptoalloteichus tenebrarius]|uniref:histidine kinase n=1 Tax=Streptoalloteichus tenebrarius (strain ATCC 17920 / DSM 40477 / JCM 4838 / CBS 697.72 / NBRC 16177 / NCIMB 11028 / NRRL B-12390 / A12253. 1 / ISP 5477) TaxID=1933 RepID=A0ABT1HT99_STRSD|nr:histidine kinase [Streptoalloteichus tenebrarius]MCP2258753.1 Signal transduction histidine kinase [Streptoalloteichus tenebrarius]BFF02906.1 histidine kinase [Streptoalloteichus tenebrarius]